MTRQEWDQTAAEFARHVKRFRHIAERGAVLLRFMDSRMKLVNDAPLVIGLFGNDDYFKDHRAKYEVDQIRERLRLAHVEEVGFGLCEDGSTWALLVRSDLPRYETAAGREFAQEVIKACLDDMVWESWRAVSDLPVGQTAGREKVHQG